MRNHSVMMMLAATSALFLALSLATTSAVASTVAGGGSSITDCALVLEIPGANSPAPPRTPKAVDCIDGDATCDADGLRNGQCIFSIQACVNSTALEKCTPDGADNVAIDHSDDNADDSRFDTDFQALQARAGAIVPTTQLDKCSLSSSITVHLIGPDASSVMKKNRKSMRVTTYGTTAFGDVRDVDKVKFTCRPEGDAVYHVTDLYSGTFDRIRKQIFSQSCATASCHDSESHQRNLILLPGAAYGNLVNVLSDTPGAAADMLLRVKPGDPTMSLLYRKLTNDLEADWGPSMPYLQGPLDDNLIELVRLWILGDGTLGPAPETGWVTGTDN